MQSSEDLSQQIRETEQTQRPIETKLATDERVLARITDGIYRQPASALRELISNAYDADATEVIVHTDAPRFQEISIRDNGSGLSPEVLGHILKHIGGSVKRTAEGKNLKVTSENNPDVSPGGRKLIGKLGIGLFSVAQFTRHFLIITKTKGDKFRTVADITLGPVAGQQIGDDYRDRDNIETGHVLSWRERAEDVNSHGTEIKLLKLLPRTRAELASDDLWTRIDYEDNEGEIGSVKTLPPQFHIGCMVRNNDELLKKQPTLPWDENDKPRERFNKLIQAVRSMSNKSSETVDLDIIFDRYLQTLWNLALAVPIEYIDVHPFDLDEKSDFLFFELANNSRGQAKQLNLETGQTLKSTLDLKASDSSLATPFKVFVDGVQLLRPILFRDLPKTSGAVKTPLLFIGRHEQAFKNKPEELSGGPLIFEAYLMWVPKVIPKQHQGVVLRIGNASGSLFDRTFMGYQVSEQTRLRQITAEIFVSRGLDGAINLDRESFNYAHPHYQYLVKWLHSALRQLTNRHKEIGKHLRSQRIEEQEKVTRGNLEDKVEEVLQSRGVEDVPAVEIREGLFGSQGETEFKEEGTYVYRSDLILPQIVVDRERTDTLQAKAVALAQLLHGWNVLDNLSYENQERLIHDILEITLFDT